MGKDIETIEAIKEVYSAAGISNISPTKINILKNDIDQWETVKAYTSKVCDSTQELYFFAHDKNSISGKPQSLCETLKNISMVSLVRKKSDDVESYVFLDGKIDKKQYLELNTLNLPMFLYRLIDRNMNEYFVLSKSKLKNEFIFLKGMIIQANTLAGIDEDSKLNIRSKSNIFLVTHSESAIKPINKEQLVKIIKENQIDLELFKNYIYTKKDDDNIYDHSQEFTTVQIAQLLSGKYEGYPLHLFLMGPVGTGKTTYLECLAEKFNESAGICEAGNSTQRVLFPSFKEKPASPGYILSSVRMGFIDELNKMISKELEHYNYQKISSSLGELNMLLEHKERTIGSGNDNTFLAKATAKLIFATNAASGFNTLSEHVKIIDQTTLSRMLLWVQDKDEQELIYNKELKTINLIKSELKRLKSPQHIHYNNIYINNNNNISLINGGTFLPNSQEFGTPGQLDSYNINDTEHTLSESDGYDMEIPEYNNTNSFGLDESNILFLSIYDSCQAFISKYDETRTKEAFQLGVEQAFMPMKQIWKARGLHHTVLLLDGIIKQRCLFKDYDSSFEAKEEDYELLNKIITKMIESWKTTI
jgi:hypothetical protein